MSGLNATAGAGSKHAPKRLIICCDGTWQSSVTNITNVPSNVTRLARSLATTGKDNNKNEWPQLVYYDAGIGTGVSDLEAKRQGGTGSGFVGNVIEAYNFLVLNYNLGDQIFCLGFSRGAYTARAVAGLVTDIGIINPRDMQDFPELYRLYQDHKKSHLFRKSEAWRQWVEGVRRFKTGDKQVSESWKHSPSMWTKRPHDEAPEASRWIEAIGVFDTVGSLGIPKIDGISGWIANLFGGFVEVEQAGFHNVALSPYIKNAYHAMAIDEHRKPFTPTLWHFPADDVAAVPQAVAPAAELRAKWRELHRTGSGSDAERAKLWEQLVDAEMAEQLKGARSNLMQVWFPGVHINIGGGSDDLLKERKSDFEQIAMLTLTWMMEQLRPHLTFEPNVAELVAEDRFHLMRPAIDEVIKKNNRSHWLMKKINDQLKKEPQVDPWNDGNETRKQLIAAEVLRGWATGPIVDSFDGAMKAAGSLDRTPGDYHDTEDLKHEHLNLGATNELMHPCVQYRIERLGSEYKSPPLKGFQRVWINELKEVTDRVKNLRANHKMKLPGYVWFKGDVVVPEYQISGAASYERSCAVSELSQKFLGDLDTRYGIDSSETAGSSKI